MGIALCLGVLYAGQQSMPSRLTITRRTSLKPSDPFVPSFRPGGDAAKEKAEKEARLSYLKEAAKSYEVRRRGGHTRFQTI